MYKWAEINNYLDYVAFGAGTTQGFDTHDRVWGYNSSARWWTFAIGLGRRWWKKNYDKPLVKRFVDEASIITEANTDLMVAFLSALQLSDEYDNREETGKDKIKNQKPAGLVPLLRMESGKVHIVKRQISPGIARMMVNIGINRRKWQK